MDKKLPALLFDLTIPTDPLEEARHTWKKGRLEFMGGPVYFEQGNESAAGLDDNNRRCAYKYPMSYANDPMTYELGTDVTEQ